MLFIENFSRAASKQRRGRAGRVKPGVCFKLFTRRTEENNMARFTIPEILRTPLESLILQIKAMNPVEDIRAFLLYVGGAKIARTSY